MSQVARAKFFVSELTFLLNSIVNGSDRRGHSKRSDYPRAGTQRLGY